uniref:Uncharacterized protein n=1 Tax=Mycena chlorophos TaxID=658473 RepID=A0ABQ0LSS7_MYCCL|nr:predicted protein [Mycena chlorophos]
MPSGAPGPVVVLGGFQVGGKFVVSASKFLRWLFLYDGRKTPLPSSSLALRKLEIVPSDPFQYWFAHQSENVLEHDSTVLIQPGIYGIYNPGQDGKPYQKAFEPPEPITCSFIELEDMILQEQLEDRAALPTAELPGRLPEPSVVSIIKKEQFIG